LQGKAKNLEAIMTKILKLQQKWQLTRQSLLAQEGKIFSFDHL
jgi:hypothetical protein